MKLDNNQQAFFALVRAGLWETEVKLSQFEQIDFNQVYRLAEDQSVVGLVAAGIEHVVDVKIPQQVALTFVGSALQLEQRNLAMNKYVANLIEQLRKEDIYAILVKGQGVAQCYERPLWRSSGDVDLLLSDANYKKAKAFLIPQAVELESEFKDFKHLGMTMKEGFMVELHGTMHSRLSQRVDKGIDDIQDDVFYGDNVRSWLNGSTQVFLPSSDTDIVFIFTHILHHYFIDGIGLRQICDWCRLLWTFKDEINVPLLEKRLKKMKLMSEWYSFAAFAVDWLGMRIASMPLYSATFKWKRNASRIMAFVMDSGNFGHNHEIRTSDNYYRRKVLAFCRKLKNFSRHFVVFPLDTIKFFCNFVLSGLSALSRKE